MATSATTFEKWLEGKLLQINPEIDTDVFVSYINGMLDEDCSEEEKMESIGDLLAGVVEDDRDGTCKEIYQKWQEFTNENTNGNSVSAQELIASQLSNLLEQQTLESVKPKEKNKEQQERKAAILAQYSTVSDEEDELERSHKPGATKTTGAEGGPRHGPTASGDDLLMAKNINADSVQQIEKEKREKAKEESDKKKEKDKADRTAQKQKAVDRKENEKKRTQKGEKRR